MGERRKHVEVAHRAVGRSGGSHGPLTNALETRKAAHQACIVRWAAIAVETHDLFRGATMMTFTPVLKCTNCGLIIEPPYSGNLRDHNCSKNKENMSITVLEVLQNAEINLVINRQAGVFVFSIGKSQLANAIAQLKKNPDASAEFVEEAPADNA